MKAHQYQDAMRPATYQSKESTRIRKGGNITRKKEKEQSICGHQCVNVVCWFFVAFCISYIYSILSIVLNTAYCAVNVPCTNYSVLSSIASIPSWNTLYLKVSIIHNQSEYLVYKTINSSATIGILSMSKNQQNSNHRNT